MSKEVWNRHMEHARNAEKAIRDEIARKNGIGDVNSDEVGSGARYNGGKLKLEYIPAYVLLDYAQKQAPDRIFDKAIIDVLLYLDIFERGHNAAAANIFASIPAEHRFKSTCDQFHFGAEKYSPWNWAKGMAWSVPIACMKRHLLALIEGKEIDGESGVHHWGGVGCNAIMLIHYAKFHHTPALDDRPGGAVWGAKPPLNEGWYKKNAPNVGNAYDPLREPGVENYDR